MKTETPLEMPGTSRVLVNLSFSLTHLRISLLVSPPRAFTFTLVYQRLADMILLSKLSISSLLIHRGKN
jgi:hypothetical protein